MSNDLNIVNEKSKENNAETCSGENKGVRDENKIVPINKTNSAETGTAASTAELAAQLVAQYAAQPLAQAVSPAGSQMFPYTAAQAANQSAVYTAAQAANQSAVYTAAQAANQPADYAAVQAANQPAVYTAAQNANQSAVYTANQSTAYTAAQNANQAQLAIQAASLSAGQPTTPADAQSVNLYAAGPEGCQPFTASAAQPDGQAMAQPAGMPTARNDSPTAAQNDSYAAARNDSPTAAQDDSYAAARNDSRTAAQNGGADVSDTGTAANTSADPAADTDIYSSEETGRDYGRSGRKRRFFRHDPDDDFDFDEEERPKKRFFRFRPADDEESRDKLILSRIKDEDLMEYLALEQRRIEFLQQAKEAKEKRILIAFQLLISLAAIVAITYLLQDNPTILISILYIVGIVAALNVWKNPHDKGRKH